MSWRNVKLIFWREVRDQLRDRRTLFMIAILPLLLYPGMGIGLVQMRVLFVEQTRTVVILGAEDLPTAANQRLIDDGRFVRNWFLPTSEADKLDLVTDLPDPEAATDAGGASTAAKSDDGRKATDRGASKDELLAVARKIREKVLQRTQIEERMTALRDELANGATKPIDVSDRARIDEELRLLSEQWETFHRELGQLFAASRIQVLILVPEGFARDIERMTTRIAERQAGLAELVDSPRPIVVQNSADEKSKIAYLRVKGAMSAWEDSLLRHRLEVARLPESIMKPVNPEPVDLAKDEQIAANLWSKLFPALLVIMAVTGAFYPAVDLAAGEKERGTMETLLICPATRSEIVVGKFFTVMLFSVATAVLNLVSMGFTGKYMVSLAGAGTLSKVGDLSIPGPGAMAWVFVLLLPLAALFSALCLALATFARSSKEGQYYLTPLLMVTLGLTVFCLSPGVEIQPFYSVMPVVGPALLLKELLASPGSTEPLLYAVPVLATSVGYSLLALWWAIDQFSREEVLFREAERFDLRLWLRHLLRDKEPIPSFAEAGFCFVLIMLLQFGAIKFLSGMLNPAHGDGAQQMMRLLLVQQLVIIASPALFMGVMLTTSVRRTFRLIWPGWKMMAVGLALPVALHPLTLELADVLQRHFFLPLPREFGERLQAMTDPGQSLWSVLLTFAVAPALCEELAFRGFILSGFGRTGRVGLAIGLSALTFGIMHMIPQQVFNATLLGLVLGLLAVRSNSLFPGIAFHLVYNALAVLHGRVVEAATQGESRGRWLIHLVDGKPHYTWPTLVVAAAIAAWLLRGLVRTPSATVAESDADAASVEASAENSTSLGALEKPPVRVG